MNFRCIHPTLQKLDEVRYDALILTSFVDERPLQGAPGLVDWRLNGYLSQLILNGHLTGEWGEQVLVPQTGRLPFNKLIVFGLGERSKYGSTRFKEITNRMLRTLTRMKCWSFATVLPGSHALKLVPRQLVDLWLGELQKVFISQRYHDLDYEIAFLSPADTQSDISEQLESFTRQLRPRR
jgi:hypothetical protein